jgi:hypothetical protein
VRGANIYLVDSATTDQKINGGWMVSDGTLVSNGGIMRRAFRKIVVKSKIGADSGAICARVFASEMRSSAVTSEAGKGVAVHIPRKRGAS